MAHPVTATLLAAALAIGAQAVSAQAYPDKPIHLLTAEPGGATDFQARLIGKGLSDSLGQQVIVENKVAGPILGEIAANARPDGYTLLLAGQFLWTSPFLYSVAWDPLRDFAPITLTSVSPNILVVHPALPANSVRDVIAMAKARPGALNYGSAGGSPHLAAELFKAMAGVNIVRVAYKGTGLALNDVISGQVQMMFAAPAGVLPHVKSGRLRALAVASAEPSAFTPGLPTIAATVPGYESSQNFGVFAPAKVPRTVITLLNQEIVRILNRPDVKEKFFGTGAEVIASAPEQLTALLKSEMSSLGKLIKDAGIRVE